MLHTLWIWYKFDAILPQTNKTNSSIMLCPARLAIIWDVAYITLKSIIGSIGIKVVSIKWNVRLFTMCIFVVEVQSTLDRILESSVWRMRCFIVSLSLKVSGITGRYISVRVLLITKIISFGLSLSGRICRRIWDKVFGMKWYVCRYSVWRVSYLKGTITDIIKWATA